MTKAVSWLAAQVFLFCEQSLQARADAARAAHQDALARLGEMGALEEAKRQLDVLHACLDWLNRLSGRRLKSGADMALTATNAMELLELLDGVQWLPERNDDLLERLLRRLSWPGDPPEAAEPPELAEPFEDAVQKADAAVPDAAIPEEDDFGEAVPMDKD